MDEIVNKVAQSNLITLDLADFYPEGKRMHIDLSQWLLEGIMLREKDFRQHLKQHDWSKYEGAFVSVNCDTDAIIPQWAFMLVGVNLQPFAKRITVGAPEDLENLLLQDALSSLNPKKYKDERVIIKGCGDKAISAEAYLTIAALLKPYVKSIMFGEACSTVPVYKNKG